MLDEELARIPDRLRTVVILCDLEGRPRHEVARQLALPEGTLSSRLARARALLAQRLARRGLTLGVADITVLLAEELARFNAATLHGESSSRAAALAERVARRMLMTKIRRMGIGLLLGTLIAAGAWVGTQHHAGGAESGKPEAVVRASAFREPKELAPAEERLPGDLGRLQGRWRLVSQKPSGSEPTKAIIWDLEGKKIHVLEDGVEKLLCAFTIDEETNPRQMDITVPQESGKKVTALGIYKIEDGKLTVCQARPERQRPREFEPGRNSPFPTVTVFER